jgi:hypothetical protein
MTTARKMMEHIEMTLKFRITEEHDYGSKKVQMYRTEVPNEEAEYAMQLLEKFALIAGAPDGEDSAGRQRGKLVAVDATVARAFDIAREAYRVARERCLMVQLPDLSEINAEADAKRAKKKEKELAD